jgi:hypothetical protein
MTEEAERAQNSYSIIPAEVIRSLAPEEQSIYFYRPPFRSVSSCQAHGEKFWDVPTTATHELDPEKTLLIGDFGLGSDAPIALDYRRDINRPSVIRLKWSQGGNHWVEMAATFEEFAKRIR